METLKQLCFWLVFQLARCRGQAGATLALQGVVMGHRVWGKATLAAGHRWVGEPGSGLL